jgi:hypothetical protein
MLLVLSVTLRDINLTEVVIGLVSSRGPMYLYQSHRGRHRTGCVVWTDEPVFMCE